MSIGRRLLLAGSAALVTTGRVAAQPAASVLPFVVLGDWGRRGSDSQAEVGATMGRSAEAVRSRFTISLGDNFYERGVTGIDDPQWSDSFERIYDAPALQTPWRVILGNHDYRGNVEAQLSYPSPRWSLPARYYDRVEAMPDGTLAHFFYIDTNPFKRSYLGSETRIEGQDTALQLAWLERQLATSTAAWRIVVGHHPIYTAAGGPFDTTELVGQVRPLLQRYRVQAYLCGHVHNMQQVDVDGVCYVTNGAGSKVQKVHHLQRNGFAAERHGFLVARLDRDALVLDAVDVSGITLNRTIVRRS